MWQDGITFRQQDSRQRLAVRAVKCKRGNVGNEVTLRCFLATIVVVEKKWILHILSVCVSLLALVIRYAKRICLVIIPSVACPALPYFSTLYNIRHNLTKKNICILGTIFIFSTTFVQNICYSKENSAMSKCTRTQVFILTHSLPAI